MSEDDAKDASVRLLWSHSMMEQLRPFMLHRVDQAIVSSLDESARLSDTPEEPHKHEWKREYAPGYRQASEADDWREECACGAVRTGSDTPEEESHRRCDCVCEIHG